MPASDIPQFYPDSTKAWRKWLTKNHLTKDAVWLVLYKKKSGVPTISWSEAVDEALCFGWIDSKAMPVDEDKYIQFFCKRKAASTWSKINKDKIIRLMDAGLMMPAGLESIEKAKQNGSWTILDEVEELIIPEDLRSALKALPGSEDFFLGLSRSVRKAMLQWIVLAKQAATREKRIHEIASLAAQGRKPKPF